MFVCKKLKSVVCLIEGTDKINSEFRKSKGLKYRKKESNENYNKLLWYIILLKLQKAELITILSLKHSME